MSDIYVQYEATVTVTHSVWRIIVNESLGSPLVAVREEEILGNRANWPNLRVGDRVIVRCFFPGESR
jgi:hypothetical protein